VIFISETYFFHVVELIEAMGVNRAGMAAAIKRELSRRPNPKSRFTLADFDALLQYARDTLSDEFIALHISEAFRISTFPGPTQFLALCKNIEEAALLNQRYADLVHNLGFAHLEKSGDPANPSAKFLWVPNYKKTDAEQYRHITEYIVSNYLLSLNWLAWGFGQGVDKVTFAHDAPASLEPYEKVYGCAVEFGAPDHAIYMRDGMINRPLPTADRRKLSILLSDLDKVMTSREESNNLVSKVENKIRETIDVRRPSLALIASDLAMNERTLRRNLKALGTSFASILEDIKKELCRTYLDEGRAFSEIAQLLWYSEQSAFTRAYKKWHGAAPTRHGYEAAK